MLFSSRGIADSVGSLSSGQFPSSKVLLCTNKPTVRIIRQPSKLWEDPAQETSRDEEDRRSVGKGGRTCEEVLSLDNFWSTTSECYPQQGRGSLTFWFW